MEHTKEGVRVGPSAYGLGVFALHSFAAHDLLGPIQGKIVADPAYSSDYCMELGEQSLEPAPPFRYLNHSCQPNCELVIDDNENGDGTRPGLSVWVEICRAIASGEQMTIDYGWPADAAIPCQCGAANCRGWIVAEDGLDEVLSATGPDQAGS
jgi:hypothetical protein